MNRLIQNTAVLLLAGLLFSAEISAQEEIAIPPLQSRVTDLTATLNQGEVGELESRLAAFEKEKGSQIAVLIVPTTGIEGIEQYAIRVVEQWKLGRKDVDDGVLLLIAKNDRKLRIEVGYGLEGALNDATAKRIVAETIAPSFKKNDYYAGISDGINAIIAVVSGETLPEPAGTGSYGEDDIPGYMLPLFFIAYVLGWILKLIFGFLAAMGMTALVVFVVSLFATGSIVSGLFAILLFAFFSLFLTIFILFGGSGRNSGGGFGGSFGSSSGGSFGGGGGSFGGGGSSGSW